jgi:hypothetical protein
MRKVALPPEYQLTIYLYVKTFYEVHYHFTCNLFSHPLRGTAPAAGSGYQDGQVVQWIYVLYQEEYGACQKSAVISGK